jgi:hypothetical protein
MSLSASVSDPDRHASAGRRESDPSQQQRGTDTPPVRSQRDLVIASLLRCPDPRGGPRGATRQ